MRRLRLLLTELHEAVKNYRHLILHKLLSLLGRLLFIQNKVLWDFPFVVSFLGADPCGGLHGPRVFLSGGAQRLAGVEDFWP